MCYVIRYLYDCGHAAGDRLYNCQHAINMQQSLHPYFACGTSESRVTVFFRHPIGKICDQCTTVMTKTGLPQPWTAAEVAAWTGLDATQMRLIATTVKGGRL